MAFLIQSGRLSFPLSRCNQSVFKRCVSSSSSNFAIFNVQDEDDFKQRVLESKEPVIADFHAKWCGPCKILGPRLERVIDAKKDRVHLAKIDIDSHSEVANEYEVAAVPSVIAFKDGKVVDKFIGLQEESNILAFVNRLTGE